MLVEEVSWTYPRNTRSTKRIRHGHVFGTYSKANLTKTYPSKPTKPQTNISTHEFGNGPHKFREFFDTTSGRRRRMAPSSGNQEVEPLIVAQHCRANRIAPPGCRRVRGNTNCHAPQEGHDGHVGVHQAAVSQAQFCRPIVGQFFFVTVAANIVHTKTP